MIDGLLPEHNVPGSFNRVMHEVQIKCYHKLSVRLSVRPSVTLVMCGHTAWVSSKVITRIISLGSSLLEAPTSALLQGKHHQNSGGMGGGVVF